MRRNGEREHPAAAPYLVGHYLLDRLVELGCRHAFGLPGDYVLGFLDQLESDDRVEWIAGCNELNAACAADGYARVAGIGALVVTAGVGDLGAAGGVAGSLAERNPVVVVSGVPGSAVAGAPSPVHHSLGDGSFDVFASMYSSITVATARLTAENHRAEIDRVVRACHLRKGPVFLVLPADVAAGPSSPPEGPLDLPNRSTRCCWPRSRGRSPAGWPRRRRRSHCSTSGSDRPVCSRP